MCPNNVDLVLMHINDEKDTVYFEMTNEGIDYIFKKLAEFSEKNDVHLHKSSLGFHETTLALEENIIEVIFKYKPISSNEMVINILPNQKILYVFCSEKGVKEFKDHLYSLKKNIERGIPEDISCMIPEWGGEWLINKKIIKNANVICHLRLYGIC